MAASCEHARRTVLAVVAALLLGACGAGEQRRSEALLGRAQEQIANGRFTPALDTLARAAREAPESESGQRARVLHLALLGGMARGYRAMAESYLEGWRAAGEAPQASRMRAAAMDYFGRARASSLDMVDATQALLKAPPAEPVRLDFSLPENPPGESETLGRIRQGQPVPDRERLEAEKKEILGGLARTLSTLAGTRGEPERVARADFYLGAGRELIELSSIYGPEALRNRRMTRLYYRRALALAERAGELAAQAGNNRQAAESEELQEYCQEALQGS
ncbi:MAG: hypothetical protein V3R29_06605 [Candidatus Acidoferrales bacterium]